MTYFLLFSFFLSFIAGKSLLIYTMEAYQLCLYQLFPSLFFAMVCIRALYESGFFHHFSSSKLSKLLQIDHASMAYVYAAIFIGMPSGAFMIQEAYQQQKLSLAASKRLLYCCCFITPAFVLFTCGISLLNSLLKGILLYIAHLAGGFGLLYITRKTTITSSQSPAYKNITFKLLKKVMTDSISIIISISGFVMLSFIASKLWFSYLPDDIAGILQIPIEFTNGIFLLNQLPIPQILKECTILFLICFAGFCIHLQYFSFISEIKLQYLTFLKYRLLHGSFAMIIYLALTIPISLLLL